jgi:hypothetical protein
MKARLFVLLLVAALLLALGTLGLACDGNGGQTELTTGVVTDEELSMMALSLAELGPKYAEFQVDEDSSGFQSKEEAIKAALDEEDEAEDVERFGRVNEYDRGYVSQEAIAAEEGVFGVQTSVILYEDADGAAGNLKDGVEDARRLTGRTSDEGTTLEDAEEFDVSDVGDEAAGLFVTGSVSAEPGQKLTFYGTLVVFRQGRLTGAIEVDSFDDQDVREEAAVLARKLEERILAVLQGEVVP